MEMARGQFKLSAQQLRFLDRCSRPKLFLMRLFEVIELRFKHLPAVVIERMKMQAMHQ